MRVLGIESSCDDTGIAIYEIGQGLLANEVHSQIAMHNDYGGVVPELASRDHIRYMLPLLQRCLETANLTINQLDGIAYTEGPGLAGALLVGASIASSLAFAHQKPCIGIHHLEGHLLSPLLANNKPTFPFVALLVSGGHTQLMRVDGIGRYQLLGETLDDAAGEAFDKTAKLLGLPYPGGPAIAQFAEQGTPGRFTFPRPMLHTNNLDFSFSGLKTAVMLTVNALPQPISEQDRHDICRCFQDAVVEVLTAKTLAALRKTHLSTLVVAGGVGANSQLRKNLDRAVTAIHGQTYYPPMHLCSDNGAMIALAGALRLQMGQTANQHHLFKVQPRWALSTDSHSSL